jgi:hypothetical protein
MFLDKAGYGLNVFPKVLCIKGLVTSQQLYWEMAEFLKDGAEWEEVRSLGIGP